MGGGAHPVWHAPNWDARLPQVINMSLVSGAELLWLNGCSTRSAVHLDHTLLFAAPEHHPWRYQSHQLLHHNAHLSSSCLVFFHCRSSWTEISKPPLTSPGADIKGLAKAKAKPKRYFSTAANQGRCDENANEDLFEIHKARTCVPGTRLSCFHLVFLFVFFSSPPFVMQRC